MSDYEELLGNLPPDVKERIDYLLKDKSDRYLPSQQEADKFLSKVDEVSRKVNDIIAGRYEPDELDRQEIEAQRKEETLKKIKERERAEIILKGKPGKGHQGGYEVMCKRCMYEFKVKLPKCTHCGKDDQLLTPEVS